MSLKFLKKSDIMLIAVLLIICAVGLFLKQTGDKNEKMLAVIIKDGKIAERIDLHAVNDKYEYDLHCTPSAKLMVEHGSIRYFDAQCKDKLCESAGRLTHIGDTAACIPSKTLVVIEGQKDNASPDVITY